MNAGTRKVLTGLLTTTLMTLAAATMAAPKPPHPTSPVQPHFPSKPAQKPHLPPCPPHKTHKPAPTHHTAHHHAHHHHPHYHPWVAGAIVLADFGVACPITDATYAMPETRVRLVNPASNKVAIKYVLNGGETQSLEAGYSVDLAPRTVLEFDRGGDAGWARFTLKAGTYKFAPGKGYWRLERQEIEADDLADDAANAAPEA